MNNEHDVIDNLKDLETFLLDIENGGLGLQGVAGVGMATNTKDGRHFIAVFDDKQSLLLARYVTEDVYEGGKEMVRNGVQKKH
ncbi:hypothetical protein HWV00_08620 [Moritella sp. 24]|uniref:hypothetical protein n=1 Tax=Moritella sp. 24 TaxID=2746230 RepID=UPI001BA4EE4F|nr:hypothetical protein [Moritella sp. 24]QUM76275.1 hypothetical protein HWV00_08620 [Moritella sp. 24]